MVTDDLVVNRRTVLKATGVTMTGMALAGCTGENQDDQSDDSGNGGGQRTDDSGNGGGQETDDSGSSTESFDGWMDNVGNYREVTDLTGESGTTIDVGGEGNDGNYTFEPAAVRVSAGTTVTWKWTGEGGSHSVIAEDGSFESELVGEEGHTFEQTFDSSGTYKYKCGPHETLGMKGVVVVE